MAAAHYQFEAIHPFTDGNGRTGRILNTLFLIDKGLLDLPILYLSRYINEHRSEYYDRLLAVTTKGAWEAWLLYMLTAVEETSLWTTAKIRAIRDLMDATVAYVSSRIAQDLQPRADRGNLHPALQPHRRHRRGEARQPNRLRAST